MILGPALAAPGIWSVYTQQKPEDADTPQKCPTYPRSLLMLLISSLLRAATATGCNKCLGDIRICGQVQQAFTS